MSETLPAVVQNNSVTTVGLFESVTMFEAGYRMAQTFAYSGMVPESFAIQKNKKIKDNYGKVIREEPFTKDEFEEEKRSKIGTCLIALDMALRLKANPLAVMQNIYVVHGKPAWSAQFLVACINKSGLFKTPLRYKFSGKENTPEWGCVAYAVDHSGETLESTKITLAMATSEGWTSKNGSKWKTMPEQMLRYRAATFFARAYCPELTMGMTVDEVQDTIDVESVPITPKQSVAKDKLQQALETKVEARDEVREVSKEEPEITDGYEEPDDFFAQDTKGAKK